MTATFESTVKDIRSPFLPRNTPRSPGSSGGPSYTDLPTGPTRRGPDRAVRGARLEPRVAGCSQRAARSSNATTLWKGQRPRPPTVPTRSQPTGKQHGASVVMVKVSEPHANSAQSPSTTTEPRNSPSSSSFGARPCEYSSGALISFPSNHPRAHRRKPTLVATTPIRLNPSLRQTRSPPGGASAAA